MKIVVAGGGYAGMACLIELRRRMRDAELILLDPAENHLKLTHLHESLRHPLSRYQVSYQQLGQRYGFTHYQSAVDLTDIGQAAVNKKVVANNETFGFDYLVVATGARPPELPKAGAVIDSVDMRQLEAGELLAEFIGNKTRPRELCVIGGGPSGIQVLFELNDQLRQTGQSFGLSLVDRDNRLLRELPSGIGAYVRKKIERDGIRYLPGTEYLGCDENELFLKELENGREYALQSGLSFLFPGVKANPQLYADRFGMIADSNAVFAAGDCVNLNSRGDDKFTAQIAVRQGKLAARNIDRMSRGVAPLEYYFKELGYVLSLGSLDAVGWMFLPDKIVNGLAAFAIKELVEAQYDLFVAGLDTYVI